MGIKQNIGDNIRQLRANKNLSQYELADKLKITQAQLSRIENGMGISVLLLEKIAEALQSTPSELTQNHQLKSSLLDRFIFIEKLPNKKQKVILQVIDALILQERMENEEEK